jgi:hypothetical protein
VLFEQITASAPALAVAGGDIVRTIWSVTEGQGPAGSFVVNVIVTDPAVISAADGVYTAVSDVALLNVPVPEVVHVELVAPPPIEPAIVNVVPEQMVASIPAFAVAGLLIVNTIASETAGHGPVGSLVVNVRVTDPAVTSAADGV